MYLGISAVLFIAFFLNVLIGSFGGGAYLRDVSEMLVLLASVLFFVLAILKREAEAKEHKDQNS